MKNRLKQWAKSFLIAFIFFLGTTFIINVDTVCHQTTGQGGELSLSVDKGTDDSIVINFMGVRGSIDF